MMGFSKIGIGTCATGSNTHFPAFLGLHPVCFPCPEAGWDFGREFWSELQLNLQQVIYQKNSLVPVK
jgi:hypothetical protein